MKSYAPSIDNAYKRICVPSSNNIDKADHCKWKRHGLNEDLQISYSITDPEANFLDILPKGRLQNCFHGQVSRVRKALSVL